MDSKPICHPSPANKMKCSFLDYVQLLMISQAGQWNRTPSASPLQPKKMKCYFLDYIKLLMISWACQWTWTPSTTCLQPKKWNAHILIMFTSDDWPGWAMDLNPIHHPSPAKKWNPHFCITFNFWCWPDWSMDSNPIHHPSPDKKNEMLVFRLCSTSDDWPGLLIDSNPIRHPSSVKKWNPHYWIMFNFWWLAELLDWLEPHPPPLSSQKHEMLVFV